MIFKLAFRNVKRQIWNYFIYFITVSITVALMFSLNTLIQSEVMTVLKDQLIDLIEPISRGVSALIAVSVAFVLGYVTRFLLGRRKKEFGLYLTLGMSRRNILSIFAAETAITFLLSLGFGLLLGLGLYQAIAYLLVNFLDLDLKLAGYSAAAAILTVVMVAAMFFVASRRFSRLPCKSKNLYAAAFGTDGTKGSGRKENYHLVRGLFACRSPVVH